MDCDARCKLKNEQLVCYSEEGETSVGLFDTQTGQSNQNRYIRLSWVRYASIIQYSGLTVRFQCHMVRLTVNPEEGDQKWFVEYLVHLIVSLLVFRGCGRYSFFFHSSLLGG